MTQESRFLSASTSSGVNCAGDESLLVGLAASEPVRPPSFRRSICTNAMTVLTSVKVPTTVAEAGKKLWMRKCANSPAKTVDTTPTRRSGAHIFHPEYPKFVDFPRLMHSLDVTPMQRRQTCLSTDAIHNREVAPTSSATREPDALP